MALVGPEKIEISDEQLEALTSTYNDLALEIEEMLHDFFKPFEIMSSQEIFQGASANAYMEYCKLIHQYTDIRYSMVLEKIKDAAAEGIRENVAEIKNKAILIENEIGAARKYALELDTLISTNQAHIQTMQMQITQLEGEIRMMT